MSLTTYRAKRDFRRTAEPGANHRRQGGGRHFVIQEHHASRPHFDLRLELGGALKSWAVPKGMPMAKGEKRLAVQVEDHPRDYLDFEGTIPEGEYGGGTVMVWDTGTWRPLTASPAKDLKGGKLHFRLEGERLQGEWYLVRLREDDQWLVVNGGGSRRRNSSAATARSVLSGRTMSGIRKAGKEAGGSSERGTNAPGFLKPMKAKSATQPPEGDWLYEIKFDGWRVVAGLDGQAVKLYGRSGADITDGFPDVVEALRGIGARETVLDGELVALDRDGRPSFQMLQARDSGSERVPVYYYVFDLLKHKGDDLTGLPLEERKAKLEQLIRGAGDAVRYSASLGGEAGPLLERAAAHGLEGLIAKRAGSRYEPGARSGAWLKLKLHREQEFVIGGWTDPQGGRKHFGSLLLGYYRNGRLQYAGRAGSGFPDSGLQELHASLKKLARAKCPFEELPAEGGRWSEGFTPAVLRKCHWVRPALVCQVKFTEWTRDGRLRHPVFLGLRKDKAAREVRREGVLR